MALTNTLVLIPSGESCESMQAHDLAAHWETDGLFKLYGYKLYFRRTQLVQRGIIPAHVVTLLCPSTGAAFRVA